MYLVRSSKMGLNILTLLCVFFLLVLISLSDAEMNRDRQFENGLFGSPGLKGYRGRDGMKGSEGDTGKDEFCPSLCFGGKGIEGFKGDQGFPGIPSPPGLQGMQGVKGRKGEMGYYGRPGSSGDVGLKGEPGFPGEMGMKGRTGPPSMDTIGERGPTGDMGAAGLRGIPGIPGFCNYTSKKSKGTGFGTEKDPADVACIYAPSDMKNGFYYFNKKETFKAHCDMTSKTTCLLTNFMPIGNITQPIDYSDRITHFWLSQYNKNNIEENYGLSARNIEWLQEQSEKVSITLRYHCSNSVPFSKGFPSKALKLLTWNEIVIAPFPTNNSSFFYSIPIETDGCQKSTGSDWSHTDITLTTKFVKRLPIIDYYISDIRDEVTQKFYIELISLCFA